MELPPGQRAREDFPRFGLPQFANRFPQEPNRIEIMVFAGAQQFAVTNEDLTALPRVTQVSDFHCVTTWSCLGLEWSGFRFRGFFDKFISEHMSEGFTFFGSQDGFRARLLTEDLFAPDVLLADRLNGEPISIAHGAPLRLIAPRHYGYKNPKHIDQIKIGMEASEFRSPMLGFMEHERARVALEERGSYVPGRILRLIYRPMVSSTVKKFHRAMQRHLSR